MRKLSSRCNKIHIMAKSDKWAWISIIISSACIVMSILTNKSFHYVTIGIFLVLILMDCIQLYSNYKKKKRHQRD